MTYTIWVSTGKNQDALLSERERTQERGKEGGEKRGREGDRKRETTEKCPCMSHL